MKLQALTLSAGLVLTGACKVERPSAGESYQQPAFFHEAFLTEDCTTCHEEDRPEPYQDLDHGAGRECRDCHSPKDDLSGWLPRLPFNHQPSPESCLDCHIKERPKPPHVKTGDCVGCHAHPDWKALK